MDVFQAKDFGGDQGEGGACRVRVKANIGDMRFVLFERVFDFANLQLGTHHQAGDIERDRDTDVKGVLIVDAHDYAIKFLFATIL